jgi:hypothetical protein
MEYGISKDKNSADLCVAVYSAFSAVKFINSQYSVKKLPKQTETF